MYQIVGLLPFVSYCCWSATLDKFVTQIWRLFMYMYHIMHLFKDLKHQKRRKYEELNC